MARVLVVDDDADLRGVVRRGLAKIGHEVEDVADGTAALDLLAARSFDLVLTDVYMETVDGMELLARMQQRGYRVPVVVMSGGGFKSQDYVLKMAESIGAVATLNKPFTIEQLRETVGPLLGAA